MPATAKFALPYPAATDPADVPLDMNKLATRIDTIGGAASGLATLDATVKVPLAQLPANVGPSLAGNLAGRPAANTVPAGTIYHATDAQGVFWTDGASWVLVAQGEPLISASSLDAAPWSTPYDGMRIRLSVDTTAGIGWSFRYRAAAPSTYKWEFVGGPWQRAFLGAFNAFSCDSTYKNIGFGIVATRAGDYAVRWSCDTYNVSAVGGNFYASLALGVGSVTPRNDGSASQILFPTGIGSSIVVAVMDTWIGNVATGQGIYEIVNGASGMNLQLGNRSIMIQPARIA
jgi:hypothetical protein